MNPIGWCDETNDGNRIVRGDGYVLVRCPDYPAAKPNGYVFEHRLAMARHLGRPLTSDELVHHRDGDRQNNAVDNLELTTNSAHVSGHMQERPKDELRAMAERNLVPIAKARRIPRVEIECACGCGQTLITPTPDRHARPRRFVNGHNQQGRHWTVSR